MCEFYGFRPLREDCEEGWCRFCVPEVARNFSLKHHRAILHDLKPEEDVICIVVGGARWAWEMAK